MTKYPETITELAGWLARGLTKNFVKTDSEIERLRRQVEDMETTLTEIRDMLADAELGGTKR